MVDAAGIIGKTKAWACYDCGKCTASCPITRAGAAYSPRRHVLSAVAGEAGTLLQNGTLFACLTCAQCNTRCPVQVTYTDLILNLRERAHGGGVEPECPHGGALQSVMRMMAAGGTNQDRLGWLDGTFETEPEKGDVFYWTGCASYYDAFFSDFGVKALDGVRAAVTLMNRAGVRPVVSARERCCGHDLLWNGDRRNFEKLARHNVELVESSGAKVLVTSCAECLRTWKVDYAPFQRGSPILAMHISEFIEGNLGHFTFKENGAKRVTYQDPCRLGRHLGIYDPPRRVLSRLPGVELSDMRRSGERALCCAGGTWSNCDRFAKRIQVDRLKEARATGAEVLVTACPKCQIHFRCAMKDPKLGAEIEIEMRDVAELAAAALA
jgi:heterodisulfide reductase subunit D